MHPFIKHIAKQLRFLPVKRREAEARRIIYNVFGFSELDFYFIRTVEPNRREKKQLKQWMQVLKNEQNDRFENANKLLKVKSALLTTLIINQITKNEKFNQSHLRGTFAYDSLSQT